MTATIPLADGEAVLWRERRAPPFMQFAAGIAAVIGMTGIAVASAWITPLLLVAAAAVVAFGYRFAAGHYLEDQVLTDRRAFVAPRVGTAYGLSLDAIDSVELKGTKATFSGGDRQFRFSFVRRHKSLRRALETGAPHISFEQRWDPNCAG